MKIHILPSIADLLRRQALEEQITEAGHEVTDGIACAHYVVGFDISPEWHKVQDSNKIVLRHGSKSDTISEKVALIDDISLTLIDSPQVTLCEWLKSAPDPFENTMKQKYRIENWRHDVRMATVETPTIEGKTIEECDEKAVKRMEELSAMPSYQWDGLRVWRIDAPAVAEKRTFLKDNGRQSGND